MLSCAGRGVSARIEGECRRVAGDGRRMAGQPGAQKQRTAAATAGMPVTLAENRRRKTGAAALSLVSNTLLVLLKLGVGLATGSIGVKSRCAIHADRVNLVI